MYISENSSHIIHKRSSPFGDSVDTAGIRQVGENGEILINVVLINVGLIPLSDPSSIEEQENDEEEEESVCVGT
jgi:hypothetical protein